MGALYIYIYIYDISSLRFKERGLCKILEQMFQIESFSYLLETQ
jgi:hypothetical protein